MAHNIKQHLWKVSLGMTSLYGPDTDFYTIGRHTNFWRNVKKNKASLTSDILLGIPKTSSSVISMRHQEDIRTFLGKEFSVFNGQDLRLRMEECLQGSKTRRAFNARRQRIAAMPQKERVLLLNSLKKEDIEFLQYSIAIQYDKSLPSSGILAFDIANYTSLCRLGAYLGYLKEDKVLDYLQEAAVLAQNSYSGFQEFGLSSTVGLLFYSGYNEYAQYLNRLYKILTHPSSYWNHIEWNLDLT